jgi:enoyl-CoA hydratase
VDPGKEFIATTSPTSGWVSKFMSLWRTPKPVIAQVHGWAVGGGSEMALCADIVIMSEDAQIGTPYSRMWGCHHAGMWVARLGLAHAKELALTGRPLNGIEAKQLGLENMGLTSTQLLGSVLDGMLRNTPEALEFINLADSEGVRKAVAGRDGPFGDYSQGEKPNPQNVIDPKPRRRSQGRS